jgi:hypothetical protein
MLFSTAAAGGYRGCFGDGRLRTTRRATGSALQFRSWGRGAMSVKSYGHDEFNLVSVVE